MYENHPVQAREFREAAKMPGPNENPVTTARNKIGDLEQRIGYIREQVERVADVQLGIEPPTPATPATNASNPISPREGEAGRLHDDLDRLNWAIARLEAQVMRLSPLGVSPDVKAPEFINAPRRIA